MINSYYEYINEVKKPFVGKTQSATDVPQCLLDIAKYINENGSLVSANVNREGRMNSLVDEDNCISLLRGSEEFEVFDEIDEFNSYTGDKIVMYNPKARFWYDISVKDVDGKIYYVNIKSSCLGTRDNLGSIDEISYGLFGITDFSGTKEKRYKRLYDAFNDAIKGDGKNYDEFDYYYLILDKNNPENAFITSMKHMNETSIVPNGSNPPFQVRWVDNSVVVELSKLELCKLILSAVWASEFKLSKRMKSITDAGFLDIENKYLSKFVKEIDNVCENYRIKRFNDYNVK